MMFLPPNWVKITILLLAGVFLLRIIFRPHKRVCQTNCSLKREPLFNVRSDRDGKLSFADSGSDLQEDDFKQDIAGEPDVFMENSFFGMEEKGPSGLGFPKVGEMDLKSPISDSNQDLIALTIMTKPGENYSGYELLQTILAAGFRYGDMNIFHRHENIDGTGEILFSLAQAVAPGTFDLNDAGAISCPGLCLFMEVKKQGMDLKTLKIMVDTAEQIAEELGGNIYDEERKPFSHESVERWKKFISNRSNHETL